MQTMMCNMTVQQLRMIAPLIRLSADDVQQYVVLRSAAADSVSSDSSFASACDAVVDGAEGGVDDDEVTSVELFLLCIDISQSVSLLTGLTVMTL